MSEAKALIVVVGIERHSTHKLEALMASYPSTGSRYFPNRRMVELPEVSVRAISRMEELMGLNPVVALFVGTWWLVPDVHNMIDHLRAHGTLCTQELLR
jgi:hypothetical protein